MVYDNLPSTPIEILMRILQDSMGETVDVLVVGECVYARMHVCFISLPTLYPFFVAQLTAGNYGSGKRGGGVSTLICAVFDDRREDEDDDEPK